ncbi:MAG: MATE family efflux transporter [Clostridia bacterium]|nr:MATE family efflux transporter [Clostridia bacterium]
MKKDDTPVRVALRMALPAIAESFFVSFAGLIDSFMVSSLGAGAVAAVGLTSQPKLLGYAMFLAMSVALSAIIARRFGEERRDDANSIMITAITVTVILSIIMGIFLTVFASPIMKLSGSNMDTHADAVLYFKIIMSCMFFNCMQICINSMQRGAGNTKITMRTNITSNTVNIIGNYLLIGGKLGFPALGIRGAAIATVFGTVVSFVMSINSIMDKEFFISIPYVIENKIKPKICALKNIISVGYSVFFEQLLLRIGFFATALMVAKQGTNELAAHQVCMHLLGLSFAFGDGLQSASVALIGRSLGEQNPDKAKLYGRTCQRIGGIISAIMAVIFLIIGKPFLKLFFNEIQIIEIGNYLIFFVIAIVLVQIRQCIYSGSLRGAGDTRYTATVAAISTTIVRTVVSYFFGYTLKWGIYGIWLGIFGDQAVRCIAGSIRFKKGKWVSIKI